MADNCDSYSLLTESAPATPQLDNLGSSDDDDDAADDIAAPTSSSDEDPVAAQAIELVLGSSGSTPGCLTNPLSAAFDHRGNIIVADTDNHRVAVFAADGSYLSLLDSPHAFRFPAGVTVDRDGRIIIADTNEHRVQVFSPEYQFLFKFGEKGRGDGEFTRPYGITTCRNTARIVVTEYGGSRVQVFDANGKFLLKFGQQGKQNGDMISPAGSCRGLGWLFDRSIDRLID